MDFLDFRVDFWISEWISGFQSGFLDFSLDFWISIGFLLTVYKISFVTDPLPGNEAKAHAQTSLKGVTTGGGHLH